MDLLVLLPFFILVAIFLWHFRRQPPPSKDACDRCGAEPGEECDPWTHNGV